MFPECEGVFSSDGSSGFSTWTCSRSLSFGICCLATVYVAAEGFRRIAVVFWRSQTHGINLLMITITLLQMLLLVFECLIMNSSKVLVVVKYFRGIQVSISCFLYGRVASEFLNRVQLFRRLLVPLIGGTIVVMSIIAVMVLFESDDIDCHHLSWLIMSMAGAILSVSFAVPGRVVLEEIRTTLSKQKRFLKSPAGFELDQSHHQLWTLLLCNMISAMTQLLLDIYIAVGVEGTSNCNSMFFEDGSGLLEQSFRLLVSMVNYLLPNFAIIYVFFLVPRHQFSQQLDVPDISRDNMYSFLLMENDEEE